MTRGRPKLPTPEIIDAQVNEEALRIGSAALDIVGAQVRETTATVFSFATRFGYQGSLNPDDIEACLKDDREEMGNITFRAGTRLILLREQCPHGEFLERLDRSGYQRREAQRLMQAALKFAFPNASTSTHLSTQKIQALPKSKVFELFSLDDEEISELKETGSVRGITLEAMDCMSVSEMRAALKNAKSEAQAAREQAEKDKANLLATHKADLQAKDRLMASVRERANKAEEKLAQLEAHGVPADQRLSDFSDDITKVGRKADDHLAEVANMVAVIEQYLTELFDPDSPQDFDRNNAILLAQRTRDQVWRLARNLGRAQSLIETSIYPLIEAEEMYLPYTAEDGAVLGNEVVG